MIDTSIQRARDGHGGGLVLRGEVGMGKSALLAYARSQAAGMRVLETAGTEPESELGFATLHRLLFPVLEGLDQLPQPQARALQIVFAQREGPVPDRFLVALATLSLISELAHDNPVLCLVDDVHWTDRASMDVLGFVARRLDAEPVAMLLTTRTEEGLQAAGSGLAELRLDGLRPQEARALLAEHGGGRLSPAEQDELLQASGGNPLAIREFAALARQTVSRGAPLPLADRLQRAFAEQVGRHPMQVRRLLLLVAADGSGRPEVLRRAAAALGLDTAALASGGLDELVVSDGAGVVFRHPLIRSAVYHDASAAERRGVHRALAAAIADEPAELERRAWHLAHAAEGADEQVAAELERSAARTMRHAGPATAAAAFGRAAELSPSQDQRARRWVAAAAAWLDAGDSARAAGLLDLAERTDPPANSLWQDVTELRAQIELRAGNPADAVALLQAVLPDAVTAVGDRSHAVELLMLLCEAAIMAGAPQVWADIAKKTVELFPAHGTDLDDTLLRLQGALASALAGSDAALAAEDRAALERIREPVTLARVAGMVWGVGDYHLAQQLRGRAVRLARTQGAAGTLAWVLLSVVSDNAAAGRLGVAAADAEEGHQLAVETGQPNTACRHQSLFALVVAHRGDQHARELAEQALAAATARELPDAAAWSRHALGLAELVAGRATQALMHLQAVLPPPTPLGIALSAVPDLVEAAVRAGEPAAVAEPLARFELWATTTRAPQLEALVARCRALLAARDHAMGEFEAALRLHAVVTQPLDQARTQLLAGEHLRRIRRRADARRYLRPAADTFIRLGADAWAGRARAELRAAGEPVPRPAVNGLAALTPQELRIAVAVSEGATNREIAAQLFLSPRTIDYHLRKVFQKTGITSRADLVRLVLVEHGT